MTPSNSNISTVKKDLEKALERNATLRKRLEKIEERRKVQLKEEETNKEEIEKIADQWRTNYFKQSQFNQKLR